MVHQPASQALSRFTILDLSRVRAGPTAVRQLADWGADVIKIEMPAALEADGALGAARDTAPNIHRALNVFKIPWGWRNRTKALGCRAVHCLEKNLTARQVGVLKDE